MAGTQRGFNAKVFRDKIRFAFTMGATPDTDNQLSFHFTDTVTFSGPADGDDVPFNPSEAVVRTVRAPIKKPCGIEYVKATDEATAFGVVVPDKLKVTLLDEDYEAVKDASYVVKDGEKYVRHIELPATGLFDVGIHQLIFIAENER